MCRGTLQLHLDASTPGLFKFLAFFFVYFTKIHINRTFTFSFVFAARYTQKLYQTILLQLSSFNIIITFFSS